MNCLGLFARYPEPGQTKTRLAAGIGDAAAAKLYECFVRDLTARCSQHCDQFVIAATPESTVSRDWFEALIAQHSPDIDCRLVFQPPGDLGARITWFFEQQAQQGTEATVLIGSDSPDLPGKYIDQAFAVLRNDHADLVLSPAADGGYVLIGMSGRPHQLMDTVRWSSPFTLLDTLASADRAGLRSEVLESWYDIDTIDNLGTLAALQQHAGQTHAAICPLTSSCLSQRLPEFNSQEKRR